MDADHYGQALLPYSLHLKTGWMPDHPMAPSLSHNTDKSLFDSVACCGYSPMAPE